MMLAVVAFVLALVALALALVTYVELRRVEANTKVLAVRLSKRSSPAGPRHGRLQHQSPPPPPEEPPVVPARGVRRWLRPTRERDTAA